jgi:hypothetical protein
MDWKLMKALQFVPQAAFIVQGAFEVFLCLVKRPPPAEAWLLGPLKQLLHAGNAILFFICPVKPV